MDYVSVFDNYTFFNTFELTLRHSNICMTHYSEYYKICAHERKPETGRPVRIQFTLHKYFTRRS